MRTRSFFAATSAIVLLSALASGCAEKCVVRTEPAGAAAYVNDQLVGITPVLFSAPRSEMGRAFRYRLEREGYVTEDGYIRKGVAPGRIVGYLFTVGLWSIVRGPTYLQNVDVALQPVGSVRSGNDAASIEQRLHRLERAYADGVINEDEYHRLRASLMHEF